MSQNSIDPQSFRQALGSFATGVTIITTRAPDGEPIGLTISSFNSVSLNPPLVLWSLAEDALSLPIFQEAEYWAVHVLSSNQQDLSNRFASKGEDKFDGMTLETGLGDIPLIPDCTARFQCKTAFQYEGGDHIIFVGEVLEFDKQDIAPLVFHGGRYAHATRRGNRDNTPRRPYLGGSFNENFLGYLLGRSHYKFYSHIKPLLAKESLSDEEFYLLSTLTLKQDMSKAQINAAMEGVLDETGEKAFLSLEERGYVEAGDTLHLTEAGSQCALRLITAAKAVESQILEELGDEEADVLKSLLNQLLDTIDPDASALWEPDQA